MWLEVAVFLRFFLGMLVGVQLLRFCRVGILDIEVTQVPRYRAKRRGRGRKGVRVARGKSFGAVFLSVINVFGVTTLLGKPKPRTQASWRSAGLGCPTAKSSSIH